MHRSSIGNSKGARLSAVVVKFSFVLSYALLSLSLSLSCTQSIPRFRISRVHRYDCRQRIFVASDTTFYKTSYAACREIYYTHIAAATIK